MRAQYNHPSMHTIGCLRGSFCNGANCNTTGLGWKAGCSGLQNSSVRYQARRQGKQHVDQCRVSNSAAPEVQRNKHVREEIENGKELVVPESLAREAVQDDVTYMSELRIRNFALIEQQTLQLQPGLTVITGESGAGKSVLVEAINQVLGGTLRLDVIRAPATSAVVEATLQLSTHAVGPVCSLMTSLGVPTRALPDHGGSNRPPQIVIVREIFMADDGVGVRSRCSVNGVPTSLRVLRELGANMVDVNAQHAAMKLREGEYQLRLLDVLSGMEGEVVDFASGVARLRAQESRLSQLRELHDADTRDHMQEMTEQVSRAGIIAGEDSSIRRRLKALEVHRSAVEQCVVVGRMLGGDGGAGGVLEAVRLAEMQLQQVADRQDALSSSVDEDGSVGDSQHSVEEEWQEDEGQAVEYINTALDQLAQAQDLLMTADRQVAAFANCFRGSVGETDELRDRLRVISRLVKRFDCTCADELLAQAQQAELALEDWYEHEGELEAVSAEVDEVRHHLAQQAVKLSLARREAAGKLRSGMQTVLRHLAMPDTRFEVQLSWQPQAGGGLLVDEEAASEVYESGGCSYRLRDSGLDVASFHVAAGPQEPLRPLAHVASGGENARMLLALKAAVGKLDVVLGGSGEHTDAPQGSGDDTTDSGCNSSASSVSNVLILDEVDSGVGGRIGGKVGSLIKLMADPVVGVCSQILCVTHLPQVAVHAVHHVCVSKGLDSEGRVVTLIRTLDDQHSRDAELRAMAGLAEE